VLAEFSVILECHRLCSARCGQLDVPRYRLTTCGGHSFKLMLHGSLPDSLRDTALSLSWFQNWRHFSRY